MLHLDQSALIRRSADNIQVSLRQFNRSELFDELQFLIAGARGEPKTTVST